ncbi:hypothetical protein AB0H83_36850 [Dactylosporangium sp. NPDC050688]|uniref:hypothetical protein n=1 Tax=Dactylosporangium sp. NPDC050688 TaxID=3157217 RepID=UPI0033E8438E
MTAQTSTTAGPQRPQLGGAEDQTDRLAELPANVREELAAITGDLADGASAFITGSLVEGFGNEHSDIDLYVVRDERPAQAVAIGIRPTRYVDCEYFDLRGLEALATRLMNAGWPQVDSLRQRDIDRHYRLSVGVPLRVTDGCRPVLARFDADVARTAYARFTLARAHASLGSAAFRLSKGHDRPARMMLRDAAAWLGNSELALEGEGYPSWKWLGEKAARRYGRGSDRFRAVVDPYLAPGPDPVRQAEALRLRMRLPDGFRALLHDRVARLPDTVRCVEADRSILLVKGADAVARADGLAEVVIRELARGAAWPEAVAAAARRTGMDELELRSGVWRETAGLRLSGFLVEEGTQ